MLTPPLREPGRRRRALGLVFAVLSLTAPLAACADPPASSHALPAETGGVGVGAQTGSPSPQATTSIRPTGEPSATPTGKPSGKPSATLPAQDYRDRLPRFERPPAPQRVRLPESTGAAWLSRIPTEQRVAFITIDDGWVKRPEAYELMRQANVPVTLFLTVNAVRDNPAYFKRLESVGAVIEAHTVTHTKLPGHSYEFQRQEICGSADLLGAWYGRRPQLFRPPYGEKDATTLKAARDCGITAAFHWRQTVDKGQVRFQVGNTVQRGDILLLHFRDRFVDDFIAALRAIKAAGLTPALLEDYV